MERKLLFLVLIIKFIRISENTIIKSKLNHDDDDLIKINKCCEKFEIHSNGLCINANETNSAVWKPMLKNNDDSLIKYKFIIGQPACGSMQTWPIYQYEGGDDKLEILPDGKLRHYTEHGHNNIENEDDSDSDKKRYYDYVQGQYCLEKTISSTQKEILFAKVCYPAKTNWSDIDFIMKKILNPIFHLIAMMLFLTIGIVYFVLPTLRDLVGNIISTISMCLLVSQAASLVRAFTQFSNHVSFLISDTILYITVLGAFFWLNSLGYYIWKTFRSRNVFLRVTDGQKYCWYSSYAWGLTLIMAAFAIFAHFFIDNVNTYESKRDAFSDEQETIGWLGIAIFFSPIAFTVLINIFFYLTTLRVINRRNVYGRIQHKLKSNFIMYTLLSAVMTITWIFLILSWLQYDGLIYTYILVNSLQAPLIFYICILRQKHVTFLLKKSCCYNEPPSTNDWGDELHYINSGDY